MKQLYSLVMLTAMSLFTATAAENLALNKTVVAGYESYPAREAVDGNAGTRWSTSGAKHVGAIVDGVEVTDETAEDWLYVDLGGFYTVDSIRFLFEGACPSDFDLLVSEDAVSWALLRHIVETPKVGNSPTDYNVYTFSNSPAARYVKIFARKAVQADFGWGISVWEMEVYGQQAIDTEKPILSDVTLQVVSYEFITLEIEAADNLGIQSCRVVDVANNIEDTCLLSVDSTITVIGLEQNTAYNLVITALDGAGNESEGSKTIVATTLQLGENIALNKLATAGHNADNAKAANDGNYDASWDSNGGKHYGKIDEESGLVIDETTSQDWWQVDLGAKYEIKTMRILFERACPTDYDLLISADGESWQVIGSYQHQPQTGSQRENFNLYEFEDLDSARYVKLFARDGFEHLAYGIRIYEVEIYGTETEPSVTLLEQLIETNTITNKVYENGQVYILRNSEKYTINGINVK